MVAWAASGKFRNAGFFCICVDPDAVGTAREFGQLYFAGAPESLINGYIDSQSDFPNFQAQLGCQGFIIFNAALKIVATKTLPWMQYRDHGFRDVEGKLLQLLQPPAPENPLNAPLGQYVRIVNLQSEDGKVLNGRLGEVVGSVGSKDNGRFVVKVGDSNKSLRPSNLEDATDAPIGKRRQVFGLTSEKGQKLNGNVGEVLGGTANNRYIVRFSDLTMSLKKENLREPQDEEFDIVKCLERVTSVGHSDMDAQHDTCMQALKDLWQDLSVSKLRHAREQLHAHFDEEEHLLTEAGFGQPIDCCNTSQGGGDFSAFGSHAKDHKRIVALADEALSSLKNVCEASDAHGGTVPKGVAIALCKAFAEHADMYDSLYEGKIAPPVSEAGEPEQMFVVD